VTDDDEALYAQLFYPDGRLRRPVVDLIVDVVCSHQGRGKPLFLARFEYVNTKWVWKQDRADAYNGDGPVNRSIGSRRSLTDDEGLKRKAMRERRRGLGTEVVLGCERCSHGGRVSAPHYSRNVDNYHADLNFLMRNPLSYNEVGAVRRVELDRLVAATRRLKRE